MIRDRPFRKPVIPPQQTIRLPGKVLPAPPRQVIVERLARVPTPPPDVIHEKWLPYEEPAPRRVVYVPAPPLVVEPPPRNVLIQWEQPDVEIVKNVSFLGTEVVDPDEYAAKYSLDFVESTNTAVSKLIGDVEYLKLVDLDAYGLGEYREQLRFL